MEERQGALAVIIVTFNSEDTIHECLAELTHGLEPGTTVVVADNASTDGTTETVRHFADVTLIENKENLGFARAVNLAVTQAPPGADLLLLNPDAIVRGRDVAELQRAKSSDERIGAIAPLVRQPEGRIQVLQGGMFPTLRRMAIHFSGMGRFTSRRPALRGHYLYVDACPPDALVDVEWVSGGCVLVDRKAWDAQGGLDETWFMYAEDIELCHRIKRDGWRIAVATSIPAMHHVGGSSNQASAHVSAMWVTNLFELYTRDFAPNSLSIHLWRITVATGLMSRALAFRLKGLTTKRDGVDWAQTSDRFRIYAVSLMRHRLP